MRLASHIFVSAYLKKVQNKGAHAYIEKKGHEKAGTLYFIIDSLDGFGDLYGPAISTEENKRLFEKKNKQALTLEEIYTHLDKESDFDSDLWIICVEDRLQRNFLEDHESLVSGLSKKDMTEEISKIFSTKKDDYL